METIKKNEEKAIITEKDLEITKKASKTYSLEKGRLPFKEEVESGKIPFNYHTLVFTKAIDSLIKEGKKEVKREEILEKAKELDLYKKPSKSTPSYIFTWWLRSLKSLGYIAN